MPKDGPPRPDFDLKELERIARTAARLWPDLAPMGGPRWTREDIAWAISVLFEETRTDRFAGAVKRAKSEKQIRNYLLKALRNRLRKRAARLQGVGLLNGLALDTVAAAKDGRGALHPMDLALLVEKAVAALSSSEQATAAAYFEGDGAPRRGCEPSDRTCKRHRARLREVVQAIVNEEALSRNEAREFIAALAARLTGGGRPIGRFRESVAPFGSLEDC